MSTPLILSVAPSAEYEGCSSLSGKTMSGDGACSLAVTEADIVHALGLQMRGTSLPLSLGIFPFPPVVSPLNGCHPSSGAKIPGSFYLSRITLLPSLSSDFLCLVELIFTLTTDFLLLTSSLQVVQIKFPDSIIKINAPSGTPAIVREHS